MYTPKDYERKAKWYESREFGDPDAAHALRCHFELVEALSEMAARHKCGCNHSACKCCERDRENEFALSKAKGTP